MNDHIIQLIPAPANFRAIYTDGQTQRQIPVLCLALMEDSSNGSRYVEPLVFTDQQGIVPVLDALEFGDYATTEFC